MSPSTDITPEDDPVLRETLKRCSPATYYAACKFRASGAPEHLHSVVLGVVERFVERDLRPKLHAPAEALDALHMSEDLGLDSLTMMEIVMVAEEVLRITISNEELTRLRTLGEVQRFIAAKIAAPHAVAGAPAEAPVENWDVATVGEEVRRIEAAASTPITHRPDHRPHHA